MKISFLVRSLASVSLRKSLNSHAPFQFDYFTVDLNEEYSALFGGVLKDQREFVHHCLHRILELYRNNANKPTSVILIGHSMVCNNS
jgi:glycosylphosphatidylinositol deacylase